MYLWNFLLYQSLVSCEKLTFCATDFTSYNFNLQQRAQNTVLKKAVIEEQEKTKTLQVI